MTTPIQQSPSDVIEDLIRRYTLKARATGTPDDIIEKNTARARALLADGGF